MSERLKNKKIAVLVEKGFEEVELTKPVEALRSEGADVSIVSPQKEKVKAWDHTDWGSEHPVDVHIDEADASTYDALVLPGGVMNPDYLRRDENSVNFVKDFFENGKPVAAICHGPWTLIEADVVKGKKMTSFPSIRTDLKNAGAIWEDKEVIVDGGLITSRNPDDIPAFNQKMITEFAS